MNGILKKSILMNFGMFVVCCLFVSLCVFVFK